MAGIMLLHISNFSFKFDCKSPLFGNDVGQYIQYFLIQRDLASFVQLSSKELWGCNRSYFEK